MAGIAVVARKVVKFPGVGLDVKELRSENKELKEAVAELTLRNRILKKTATGSFFGDDDT